MSNIDDNTSACMTIIPSKISEDITKETTTKKTLKKKLKKERQREKKNQLQMEAAALTLQNQLSIPKKEQDIDVKSTDHGSETMNTSDLESVEENNVVVDYGIEIPAFIKSIMDRKDVTKKKQEIDTSKNKNLSKDTERNFEPNKLVADDEDDFVRLRKGTKQGARIFCKTSKGFGEEAVHMILEGNFELAIKYLNRAIALDPFDIRHYVNRSYCFLRTRNYHSAFDDVKYVTDHASDIHTLSIAKCRMGLIHAGCENYEDAAEAFRESINLAPDYNPALREMKRMEVLQLMQLGFSERDGILALQNKPTFTEALVYLMETSVNNNDKPCKTIPDYDDWSDDDIFNSDTEDSPSNTTLLSNLCKHEPLVSEICNVKETSKECKKSQKVPMLIGGLRVLKAVVNQQKPKTNNAAINDKAIWVGNLSDEMDDTFLKKKFSRFGKVDSVRRPMNSRYAFVNFQCASSVQVALNEAAYNRGGIEVNGINLTIKPAILKTMKF